MENFNRVMSPLMLNISQLEASLQNPAVSAQEKQQQQNLYNEALQILETESMGSFEAKYEEIKGDILSKKGEFSEAQAAYLKALDLLLPGEFDYEYILMKFKDIQSEDLNDAEASKDGNA